MANCKYPVLRKRYKELRESVGFTQEELAKRLELQTTQISMLENGKREPSTSELKAYNKFFNIPMEYLLGIKDKSYYTNISLEEEIGLSEKNINFLKYCKEKSFDTPVYKNQYCIALKALNSLIESNFFMTLMMSMHDFLSSKPLTPEEEMYLKKELDISCGEYDFKKMDDIQLKVEEVLKGYDLKNEEFTDLDLRLVLRARYNLQAMEYSDKQLLAHYVEDLIWQSKDPFENLDELSANKKFQDLKTQRFKIEHSLNTIQKYLRKINQEINQGRE